MHIIPIPCLSDNFAYLLICPHSKEAAVVDPSQYKPILNSIQSNQVKFKCILNTHHHWDHVGGNDELLKHFPEIDVYAHALDNGRVPGQTHFLNDGDEVRFGKQSGKIIHNPGHTSGAITYIFGENAFTGDTLFSAGCGRIFEGNALIMHNSINHLIGKLPNTTKIYFGHEYTEKNLLFAQSIEPYNTAITKKLDHIRTIRQKGQWSTPSILDDERKINPFMRCHSPEIKKNLLSRNPDASMDEISVFSMIRSLKDTY